MNKEAENLIKIAKSLLSADIDPMISRIERMTQDNNHNGAMLYLVAKILRNSVLTKKMKEIERASSKLGYMSQGLIDARKKVQDVAFRMAKKQFNPDIYKRLHGAF